MRAASAAIMASTVLPVVRGSAFTDELDRRAARGMRLAKSSTQFAVSTHDGHAFHCRQQPAARFMGRSGGAAGRRAWRTTVLRGCSMRTAGCMM